MLVLKLIRMVASQTQTHTFNPWGSGLFSQVGYQAS